ncbi:SRPBCC family protein [Thalassoglobus sp. JC818]|uniref:SRPBCC family protein n=1 Tax=Thalassoglobus sp. JC818 TaxID=3232136 RepID=UPI0034573DF1
MFLFTGVGHFLMTTPMADMLPPWIPMRAELVYVTGILEIIAAAAVLVPRYRTLTGWIMIGMLLLFLPVNIYAAVNHVRMGGHQWGPIYLLVRVPLQLLLIGWTWRMAVESAAPKPIRFACEITLPEQPEEIASKILDLSKWPEFNGYGPLPGIKAAEFEIETPEIIGTRIRVTNQDGSTQVEEIVNWEPTRQVRLHMSEFSRPLSGLATSFDELWEFERNGDKTHIVRTFQMFPKSNLTKPVLWMISFLLKRAIARHLKQMAKTD